MQKIIGLILTLFLAGCTSFLHQTPITQSVNHYLPWAERKTQLNTLDKWQANGNIAIHNSNSLGVNASFSWQQIKRNYKLRIFGPFGTQSILLSGNPQQVTLTTHNQVFNSDNPESLLEQQSGLHLPVSQLYFWLRGLPTPQLRYTVNLDAYNRLLKLRQSGWRIDYLHYTNVGKLDIPDQILLTHKLWKIRILITRWNIN